MSTHYKISQTRAFLEKLHALDPAIFAKWKRVGSTLYADPFHRSLKTERIGAAQDGVYSARLDDQYRLLFWLVPPNHIVLFWIDTHNEAYDKAKSARVEISEELVTLIEVREQQAEAERPAVSMRPRHGKLFDRWSDAELRNCGLADDLLPLVRRLDSEEEFWAIEGRIPSATFDRLLELLSPPQPPSLFVSPPTLPPKIFNRDDEREALNRLLFGEQPILVFLTGSSGMGKKTLAAWAYAEAYRYGFTVRWLAGNESRDMTINTILAAIAREAPEEQQAMIHGQHQGLNDRLRAALGLLNEAHYLLVLDAYDALSNPDGIDKFLQSALRHSGGLRIIVTARERPIWLDEPDWPQNAALEIALRALPINAFADLIESNRLPMKSRPAQLKTVWQKTSGNPGILIKSRSVIHDHLLLNTLADMPVYSDDWLSDILTPDARTLAERLSVVGARVDRRLIDYLCGEIAFISLLSELLDKEVMRHADPPGTFVMNDSTRDYFYWKMNELNRRHTHHQIGSYLAGLAGDEPDTLRRAEQLAEALAHFDKAQVAGADILRVARETFALLNRVGDRDRALTVAGMALAAAVQTQNRYAECSWLLEIADHLMDQERFTDAAVRLEEAVRALENIEETTASVQADDKTRLHMRLHILQGRRGYRTQDYDTAQAHFQAALKLARILSDLKTEADCLIRIGQVERRRANYAPAREHLIGALAIASDQRLQWLAFQCLSHLGLIERKQGRITEAAEYYRQAYQMALEMRDPLKQEVVLSETGLLAARANRLAEAEDYLRKALDRARQIRNLRGVRIGLTRLIEILIRRQKHDEAEELLAESEQRNQEAQDRIGIAWNLKHRGQIEQARGNVEDGNNIILQGIQHLEQMGDEDYIPEFRSALM